MNSLDLDINNYNINDLERFFQLKPKSKYSASDIELKEYQIREQLLNSGQINKKFKRDLIEFLSIAKDWLIFVKCNKMENQPTTIPKNYKLDKTDDVPLSKQPSSRDGELINRNDTNFINTQSGDFFPGIMNPLNTRIVTKCLNIDTRFRDNIYYSQSSDFTINLPIKLQKVVSMQLAAIEFPVTFYGISQSNGNNFLYMEVEYTSIDGNETPNQKETSVFVIPDGNYNVADFVQLINLLLRPLNSDNTFANPTNIFSYVQMVADISTSGSGTGKLTIQAAGQYAANVTNITLDFTRNFMGIVDTIPITTKIGWNLGFIKSVYTGSVFYTGDTVVEPCNARYLYLIVDDFNKSANNHFISVFNKSTLSPNILARISIKGSYFSIVMENDYSIVSEPRKYFGPVDIHKLKIQLVDEHGRVMDMNNANFSFCINLKMMYDM